MSDKERPLNKRGEKDAPLMGTRLAKRSLKPDLILSSSAIRAVTTAQIIAGKLDYPVDQIVVTDDLYATEAEKIIDLLHHVDSKNDVVCLFGHNPEFTELAQQLTSGEVQHIPTCGVVELTYKAKTWADFETKKPTQVWIDQPKQAD